MRARPFFLLVIAACGGGNQRPVATPIVPAPGDPSHPADCSSLRVDAERAHAEGRLDRAVRFLREAAERCPADASKGAALLATTTAEIARADGDGAAMLAKARAALAAGRLVEAHSGFSRALAAFERERNAKVRVGAPVPQGTADASIGDASIAFAREREILVCDAPSFAPRRRLLFPESGDGVYVRNLAMTRDGSKVAASYGNGTVVVWDVEAAKITARIEASKKFIVGLAWVGSTLVVAGEENLRTFDASGKALATTSIKTGIAAIAALPKGDQVAVAAFKGPITIHEVARLGIVRSLSAPPAPPTRLDASGQLLAVSVEDSPTASIQLYDLASGRKTRAFSLVGEGALSPDGKLLAGSFETGLQVFDLARGTPIASEKSLQHPRFLPDGTMTARDEEGTVFVVDPKTAAKKVVAPVARAPKRPIFGPATRTVVATRSGIEICDLAPKLDCREIAGDYRDVAWDEKATRLVAIRAEDGMVDVWNGKFERTHRLLDHPRDHNIPQHNNRISISADGDRAVTSEYLVHVLDLKGGVEDPRFSKMKLEGHEGVAISPDGKIAASSWGPHVELYDLVDPKKLGEVKMAGEPRALRFSRDGAVLAAGVRGSIALVDVATRTVTSTASVDPGKHGTTNAFAFSPDGRTLAVAQGHEARLFDRQGLTPGRALGPFEGYVFGIDWRPDGKLIATTSPTDNTQLWTPEGKLVAWLGFVEGEAAFAIDESRERVEVYGTAARWLTCDVGGTTLPFELCEDRVVREGLFR